MSDALPRTLDTATAERGLNRRQLVKAGVWAAPAVVLATAAPAAATSRGIVKIIKIASPATGPWTVTVTVQANEAATGSVSLSGSSSHVAVTPASRSFTLPSAGTTTVEFTVSVTDNGSRSVTATPSVQTIPGAAHKGLSATVKNGAAISASQQF